MEDNTFINSVNILDWLKIAFQQPSNEFIEEFYYDKQSKEFFSLLIIDTILFDKQYKSIKNIPHLFTKDEIKTIKKRIKKIQNQSNTIINLPRLGNIEESKLLDHIYSFIDENKIQLNKVSFFHIYQKKNNTMENKNLNISKSIFKNFMRLLKLKK